MSTELVALVAKLEMLKTQRNRREDHWLKLASEAEAGQVAFDAIPTLLALEVENAQLRNDYEELRRWIEDPTLYIRQIT